MISVLSISEIYKRYYGGNRVDFFPHQMTPWSELEGRVAISDVDNITFPVVFNGLDFEGCAVRCYEIVACTHFDFSADTEECMLAI